MKVAEKGVELGAIALVVVSVLFFVFMLTKVPVIGVYKLSAATFGVFKALWWSILGFLAICAYIDANKKVSKE
jgi:hypothetical protein